MLVTSLLHIMNLQVGTIRRVLVLVSPAGAGRGVKELVSSRLKLAINNVNVDQSS